MYVVCLCVCVKKVSTAVVCFFRLLHFYSQYFLVIPGTGTVLRQDRDTGQLQTGRTKRTIRHCWKYGLDLWKARNALVHGTDGAMSVMEIKRTELLVQAMYKELLPGVNYWRQEIAPLMETEMLQLSHQSQGAWLEQIRMFFPDQYSDVAIRTVGKQISELEEEARCMRKTGQTVLG